MPKTGWKYTKAGPDKGSSHMLKKSNASSKVNRVAPHAGARDAATIRRLKMYTTGKAIRNKEGKIVGGQFMMKDRAGDREIDGGTGRIAPDRRWFGNTRVVNPTELDRFREQMNEAASDPYSVVLKRRRLPMGLLQDAVSNGGRNNAGLLANEPFETAFGAKSSRKRVKVDQLLTDRRTTLEREEERKRRRKRGANESGAEAVGRGASSPTETDANENGDAGGYAALLRAARASNDHYESVNNAEGIVPWGRDRGVERDSGEGVDWRPAKKDDLFLKGQSRRIWGEFFKVIDCSDVVLHIIDARDVSGTRCTMIERHISNNAKHKHLVFVLNKVDLVPNWVAKRWMGILAKDRPTIAFHASLTGAFGKGALLSLLRQFGRLHSDRKMISVGVVGYPNVGKSSVVNTLVSKKSCKVAPVPGETKVWQYISLFRNVSLIDSPGVVVNAADDTEEDSVLKGVVRAERLENPEDFVPCVLERVRREHVVAQYFTSRRKRAAEERAKDKEKDGEVEWTTHVELLEKMALRAGRLLKGGEPCIRSVAVTILNDYQRGKLPHFVPPPELKEDEGEGEDGRRSTTAAIDGIKMANQNLDEVEEQHKRSSKETEEGDDSATAMETEAPSNTTEEEKGADSAVAEMEVEQNENKEKTEEEEQTTKKKRKRKEASPTTKKKAAPSIVIGEGK